MNPENTVAQQKLSIFLTLKNFIKDYKDQLHQVPAIPKHYSDGADVTYKLKDDTIFICLDTPTFTVASLEFKVPKHELFATDLQFYIYDQVKWQPAAYGLLQSAINQILGELKAQLREL